MGSDKTMNNEDGGLGAQDGCTIIPSEVFMALGSLPHETNCQTHWLKVSE